MAPSGRLLLRRAGRTRRRHWCGTRTVVTLRSLPGPCRYPVRVVTRVRVALGVVKLDLREFAAERALP